MKVVLLAPTPPPAGGIASWTLRMLNTQLKNDWEVVVVDEKVGKERVLFTDFQKRKIVSEILRCFRIWTGLWKALNDKEARIVQACISAGPLPMLRELVSLFLTKMRRRKFIIHYRCTIPNTIHGKIDYILLKLLTDISDSVFVLNSKSKDYLSKLTNTQIHIIPNFVEEKTIADERSINTDIKTIVYVGGVIPSKGCDDIMEIAKHFPGIKFRLIGNVGESIKNMHTPGNVMLTGEKNREGVKNELDNADIFLFMTRFEGEGFSNALVEAMASGLPCIVSDWAANMDMIGNDEGLVVPIHGISEACRAINKLSAIEIRKKVSDSNIQKVRRCYSEKVVTGLYVDAYESIV